MSPNGTPRPSRRRWLRFSLRSLFVLTTLACVVSGIWVYPAERERRAADALRELGAEVKYELAFDLDGAPGIVRRMHGLLGDAYFGHVVSVEWWDCDDAGLVHLGAFPRVEELILGSDDVANVGVDHLRGLRHLKRLSLRSWQLTAGCYECLADSTSLQELTLDGGKYNDTTQTLDVVPLSDEAMRRVCELTSVEVLTLKNCGIKGAVLRHLPGLPRLRKLRLQYSDVTDEGLAHLSGLPLRELALTGNDVSDEGLAHLSGMRSLRSLSLHERAIHGPGLRHVAHLPLEKLALGKASIDDDSIEYVLQCESVKSLSFIYSRVTEAGFLRLRELPRLELLSSPFSGVGPEFKAQFWEQRPGCEIYIRTFRDRPE